MSFPLRSHFHFLGLGVLSIALSGCNIAATPYLWRSYAESASIINLGLTTTVTSTTGVTFQLLRGSNGSLLRKLESDGTLGWQQELVDSTFERLLLSGTSVILVDADNTATQLSDTGDTRWVRSLAPKTAALQSIISKNGRLTVIYHAESEFIAHVETIDADNGSTLWTQAIGDAANLQFDTLATGVTNEAGETLLISRMRDSQQDPRLQTLRLSASGEPIFQQNVADTLPVANIVKSYSLNDRHVIEYFDASIGSTLLIALDDNGSEQWRTTLAGNVSCDEGTGYTLGCLVYGTSDDTLVWINTETGSTLNTLTDVFPAAELQPTFSRRGRLKSNDEGKWIVLTSLVPSDPANALQAKTERQFYHQFRVYSETGKKLKTITLEPGYVTYIYDLLAWWGQSHWHPFTTRLGDQIQQFSAHSDTLTVSGYDGYYGSAAPGTTLDKFVSAYALD